MQDSTRTSRITPEPSEAAAGAGKDGGYGGGVLPRPTSVIELAVMMLAILAVDWIWPALEVHDLQPSPYWLPVLLLSAQYGTVSGALAVIVAIAFYFTFATFPEQGVGENEFAYRLRTLSQPILWIAAALLLGQFRMMQIAAKRELSRKVLELDVERQTLADYAQRLRGRCDLLEREIAGRPLDAARAALAAIGRLNEPVPPGHVRDAEAARQLIGRALAAAYPDASLSLYLRDGDGFEVTATTRPPNDVLFLDALPATHPLARAILDRPLGLRILNEADESALGSQGLAAVPIAHHATGRVLGMVKMERASARLVSETLTTELAALAHAIEPLLVEAGTKVHLAPPPATASPATSPMAS